MVINIISPHASHYLGGMEVVTIHMAIHLAKSGVNVRFFTRQPATTTDIYEQLLAESSDSLQIIEIPLPPSSPWPDSTWPTFYRIACDFGIAAQPLYKQYQDADLFVTHLSLDSLFVPKESKNILHLHGSPSETDPMMAAAVQIPTATIAHSQSIKNWWSEQLNQLTPAVFLNGVDTTYFNGDPATNRDIDILYVGRFMQHKGIDDILTAARTGQKIVIAGNGPYLPELRRLAEELGLQSSVTFYDTPSTETIQQLYQRSKLFACPSRGREGLLTTLLEAGASGCAVVTTSGSGMTDLVQDGILGIVVSTGDTAALQTAFDTLLADTAKRLTIAGNLQSEVRNSWSWESKIVELKGLYDAAL